MGAITVQQMADRVAALMEERLGVRGSGLRDKLRRGGRRLPRRVRKEAEYLAEVAFLAQNPKVQTMLDDARIAAAYDACVRHLQGAAGKGRAAAFLVNLAGSVVFQLAVVAGLALAVARWRGLL
ncbi:MAG: hypothetical protein ACK4TB_00400 [Gemmobacter sp.]